MAKHKHLSITLRQTALKAGLSLVAVSTMFGGMALAADGGSGSSGGTTGGGGYTSQVVWATNDNFGPASDQTVMSRAHGSACRQDIYEYRVECGHGDRECESRL